MERFKIILLLLVFMVGCQGGNFIDDEIRKELSLSHYNNKYEKILSNHKDVIKNLSIIDEQLRLKSDYIILDELNHDSYIFKFLLLNELYNENKLIVAYIMTMNRYNNIITSYELHALNKNHCNRICEKALVHYYNKLKELVEYQLDISLRGENVIEDIKPVIKTAINEKLK